MASFGRILWKWTAGVFAVLAIGLALLFGAFRVAVSHAPEYRQPIEARASETIGLPVSIGRLDARLGLDGPQVVFKDVTVLSEDRQTRLLEAGTAAVSLSVADLLLRWRVRWDNVTLDGIHLDVVREADGEVRVLGRRLDEFERGGEDRPLPLGEFRLRNSRMTFEDRAVGDLGHQPVTWLLDEVNLNITNGRSGLRVSGDFIPPPATGDRVVFWADRSRGEDRWRAYAASQNLEFASLARVRELAGIVPAGGRAEIRAWVDGEGAAVRSANVEFDLANVALPPIYAPAAHPGAPATPRDPAVEYQRLAGRLEWSRDEHGWQAAVRNLDLQRGASSWRTRSVNAGSSVEPLSGRRRIEIAADYIRLDDLQPLVSRLPGEALRGQLDAMAPRGEVRALTVEVESGVAGPDADYQVMVEADVTDISVRPSGRFPGVTGLTGRVRSDPRGGRFELDGSALTVEFSRLFRQPLALEHADGLLLWNFGADGLILIGDGLALANADLALDVGFRIRLADDTQPGSIDLRGEVTDLNVARVGVYLPVGIMRQTVVGWLDEALDAGRVAQADVVIQGPLRGFPYRDDQGEFRASFTARNLDLDYVRGWPVAEGLTADILFENEGLSAVIREGTLRGMNVGAVRVEMPDLVLGELTVKGDLSGPLPALHGYLLDSPPVRQSLDPGLSELDVRGGQAEVDVDLLLPLKALESRRVDVDVALAQGEILYGDVFEPLKSLTGSLRVSGQDVFGEGITGRLLEQPVWIDVAPFEDLGVRASIRMETTAEALVEGLVPPLRRYASGATELTGFLQFPRPGSGNEFWMYYESDLEGLALSLPTPLAKTAGTKVPFRFECRFPGDGLQDWTMQLGDEMAAAVRMANVGDRLEFRRATVHGGSLDVRPRAGDGLFVRGHFDEVSVDEWLEVDFRDEDETDEETRFEDFFAGIDAHVDDILIVGQRIAGAAVRMTPDAGAWRISVDSEAAAGEVTVPFDLTGRTEPIVLDMERLTFFDEERDGDGEAVDPTTVPPLQIRVTDFRSHEINLGQVEADVEPLPAGFHVPFFKAIGPSFEINGTLRSELGGGIDRSTLFADLKSTDLAASLEFAGFAPSVDTSETEFRVELAWQGGLVPDILAVAQGTASLRLGSGSLTEVKPGAGRVFGLLSVQALPRRLMLDFRDVFKKGFFFDKFGGDFTIANGRAETDNLAMKGRAADIGIIGTVNLVDREYDQIAVVSAQIGNTLPVVGAIAAGPIIGGGLFVLKEILKEPLREAGQVQYRISGPWEDPTVAKVTDGGTGTQVSQSSDESESEGG